MAAKIFRINYKSDFILTLNSDAGWMTPFCIKFWTGAPSQAFYAQWDGTTYTHCSYDPSEPTKLLVQFDDHHLPIGDLKFQIAYHFTVADFPNDTEDEVINPANITIEIDGEEYQVMLDFTGETAPEIQFSLPAYANEVQRIANEQQRIANEQQRISSEGERIEAEQARVTNETQRIANEQGRIEQENLRVSEFRSLKAQSEEATAHAEEAALLAKDKALSAANAASLAKDNALLAENAASLANEKAQLAQTKAEYAETNGTYANRQGDYANRQGDYAKEQGTYAKEQGDYAKEQGDYAKQKGVDAAVQMLQQEREFSSAQALREQAFNDAQSARTQTFNESQASRQTAYEAAEGTEAGSVAGDGSRWGAFKTNEAARDAEVDAKVEDITTLQTKVAALEAVVADIETIAEGYVRVAGSSSPALSYKSYKYHEQGGFGRESVFSLFYPCLVGTKLTGNDAQVGKILHILQKLDYGHDIYGNIRKIDGSEGDVMICNIEPYYRIIGKHTVDGTEYDVFLMSRTPFTWQGIEAERVGKFGWSPDFTVSHTDTDNVVRMHSVYNPEWAGSYSAPYGVAGKYIFSQDAETGDITEAYDANETLLGGSGGLHTTDKALYNGEQEAMNHNPDTTKCVPFMNQTAAGAENFFALILAEGGTFDAHNATLMGSGFSSNDAATAVGDWEESGSGAKNGVRAKDKDGNWKYYSLGGNVKFLTNASSTTYAANIVNSWRNPWHIMEAHRAVCYAIQNGVHELEWFVYDGNKYKWRSVNGFNGPAQGEMTCVVWKLIATQAGASAVDPTDGTTSIAGNRVEILVSAAMLHGMLTQVSPAWNTSGMIMTEDEHGNYECYIERDQESLIKSENGEISVDSQFDFERRYEHVVSLTNGSGYAKNYSNDALMLPDNNADKTGGGLHTYIGKYNYFTGSAPSAGKKLVRAWRRGGYASSSNLSPLYVHASYAPSFTFAGCAFGTCCRITESET
ncbi:MAG: hypothetical protein K6E67_10355 [Prevotella sp.]|nr:hypothetical protein [Prevotella sp.]